jgi:hypothetical protein
MLARFTVGNGAFKSETPLRTGRFHKKPGRDPIENARAALFLSELSYVAKDPTYLGAARRVWREYSNDLDKAKLVTADWALAMDAAVAPVFPRPPSDVSRPVPPVRTPRTKVKSPIIVPETRVGVRQR